jgi:hypothetical protein
MQARNRRKFDKETRWTLSNQRHQEILEGLETTETKKLNSTKK